MHKYLYIKNIIHYTFWCFDDCYWEELCAVLHVGSVLL